MYAFNRKIYVNTGKYSTKRGQFKLSLGILDTIQKQTSQNTGSSESKWIKRKHQEGDKNWDS